MTTASELLEETNAAIRECLKSQAFTQRGRSFQKAQLAELRKFRSELIAEINEANAGGGSMCTLGEIMPVN